MHSLKSALIYGFLVWLIPFVAAVPFYSPEGEPIIDIFLFKTIMIVVGSLAGAFFLLRYFKGVTADFVREGMMIGVIWLAMNWALDFAVLLQMSDMTIGAYFTEIGLRYLTMPIFSIAIGMALAKKA